MLTVVKVAPQVIVLLKLNLQVALWLYY